jgi:hypothetical protein
MTHTVNCVSTSPTDCSGEDSSSPMISEVSPAMSSPPEPSLGTTSTTAAVVAPARMRSTWLVELPDTNHSCAVRAAGRSSPSTRRTVSPSCWKGKSMTMGARAYTHSGTIMSRKWFSTPGPHTMM